MQDLYHQQYLSRSSAVLVTISLSGMLEGSQELQFLSLCSTGADSQNSANREQEILQKKWISCD